MKKLQLLKTVLLLCALIVGSGNLWAATYVKVTSNSQLVSGDVYIIAKSDAIATAYSSGSLTTTATGFTESTGTITTSTASPLEFTLGTQSSNYTLTYTDGVNTKYLGYNSSTNFRNSASDASATNEQWTIAYNETYSCYTIVNVQTTTRFIGTGTNVFKPYASMSSNAPATLYKKQVGLNVETPTFSPAAGTYIGTQSVSISCATDGAIIYYTTDGSEPTTSSAVYSSAISVSSTSTIKVLAKKAGLTDATASAAYTILATPSPNPVSVNSNYYTLVTDASSLADGDAILIVSGDKALGTTQNTNNRASADVTVVSSAIDAPGALVQKLILVKQGAYYFFYTGASGYLYAAHSSNNYLRTEETADGNAAATISIAGGGEATILFQGSNTRNYIRFNTPNFSCYASGSSTGTAVSIYKEVTKPAGVKKAAEFAFPKATYYNAKDVEAFIAPTLSKAAEYDGTVVYSSSVTSVAEVNSSTGAVTIKSAGTTVITAAADATANFYEDETSYTLNVYEVEDGVFDFSLGNYLSAAEPGTDNMNTEETTWTAGNVTLDVAGRNIWYNGGELRLYKTIGVNAAGNITLSVSGEYYITKIVLAGGNNLSLTSGGGSKTGTTWTGKSKSVKFTHSDENTITLSKITVYYSPETYNVTMGADEWMTYCNPNAAVQFAGVKAYVVSAVGADVTLTSVDEVPVNTPVVLNGTAGTKTFTVIESAGAVSNQLKYSTGYTTGDGSTIYALAKKSGVVGFYLVKSGVTVPAGKAYLKVESGDAREFIGFGDTTGIGEVRGKMSDVRAEYYNLAGQRVAQPTKGLYIVNGKKVIIK